MLTAERQSVFTPMFLADAQLQKQQLTARAKVIARNKVIPIKDNVLKSFLSEIKISVDRIRARGGVVFFIRPPSNGASLERENLLFPRSEYWDRLLNYTNTPGCHFADNPAIANLVCVDESHLSPSNAIIYTTQLIEILKKEHHWSFQKSK